MSIDERELTKSCEKLLAELHGVVTWKWDERFNALLAEVASADQEKILAVLEQHLEQQWDVKNIVKAPAAIKAKAGFFSDLRPNQLLFTSSPTGQAFVLAAWWPWGDGKVISVRLYSPQPGTETAQPTGLLRRIGGFFTK
jgi:hypothetical protein